MFTADSRYLSQPTYTASLPDGTQVTAVTPPQPNPVPLIGYYQRVGPGRLDLMAVQYLNAPTGFWRLCDANNSMVAGRPRRPRAHRHPAGRHRVSVTVQLGVGGQPVPAALYDAIAQLEVEESSDQPGALMIALPTNRTPAGDLQFVGDGTFEPLTNITVTVTLGTSGSSPQCVFDGYVLSWRLHLDRASTSSTVEVWAQDASWLMNMDDSVTEWPSGQTDGEVANAIFGKYGFTPAGGNRRTIPPATLSIGHTLFQRATDLQFVRGLARRGGKLCRVGCTDTAGATDRVLRESCGRRPARNHDLADRPHQLDR